MACKGWINFVYRKFILREKSEVGTSCENCNEGHTFIRRRVKITGVNPSKDKKDRTRSVTGTSVSGDSSAEYTAKSTASISESTPDTSKLTGNTTKLTVNTTESTSTTESTDNSTESTTTESTDSSTESSTTPESGSTQSAVTVIAVIETGWNKSTGQEENDTLEKTKANEQPDVDSAIERLAEKSATPERLEDNSNKREIQMKQPEVVIIVTPPSEETKQDEDSLKAATSTQVSIESTEIIGESRTQSITEQVPSENLTDSTKIINTESVHGPSTAEEVSWNDVLTELSKVMNTQTPQTCVAEQVTREDLSTESTKIINTESLQVPSVNTEISKVITESALNITSEENATTMLEGTSGTLGAFSKDQPMSASVNKPDSSEIKTESAGTQNEDLSTHAKIDKQETIDIEHLTNTDASNKASKMDSTSLSPAGVSSKIKMSPRIQELIAEIQRVSELKHDITLKEVMDNLEIDANESISDNFNVTGTSVSTDGANMSQLEASEPQGASGIEEEPVQKVSQAVTKLETTSEVAKPKKFKWKDPERDSCSLA